jgi:hypothetical protein
MGKYAYGITSFEVGDIATLDGAIENPVDLTDVIYKDTITIDEPEATETNHFVEGSSRYPVVSIDEAGLTKVMANLFGATPAQKVSLMGGAVTTVDTVDSWNAPEENVNIEKYLKITLKSGHVIQYPRVKVSGRTTGEVSEKGVLVHPIKATVLKPNFAALKPVIIAEPA